jgi:hypothetical protein
MAEIEMHSVVALIHDMPGEGLVRGQVGTVGREIDMFTRKRNGAAAVLIWLASAGISLVTRAPQFGAIRNVDMLQPTASGACLGVAIALMSLKSWT